MFGRLKCHFCGKRSKYSRGTTTFECAHCEAHNFFDSKGEVVDPPYRLTESPEPEPSRESLLSFQNRAQPAGEQGGQTFCQTCVLNQRMYMETLNNYLPDDLDEDDPKFKQYMKQLPGFKEELEKRYPQVCTKCRATAQGKLYRADYNALSHNAGLRLRETRARRGQSPVGQRDDWGKWRMRLLLNLIGMIVYASLLVQVMWHVYEGFTLYVISSTQPDEFDETSFLFEPTYQDFAKQSRFLSSDKSYNQLFAALLPKSLITSLCLLWYNPGLKYWWHHTHRVETVSGQKSYFWIQAFMLVVRVAAWLKLSNPPSPSDYPAQQLLATHGFIIVFMLLGQWLSHRQIKFEKWRINGSIMPKFEDQDVFGETAGPAKEDFTQQASSTTPLRLFARDDKPFDINSLAPKPRSFRGYSRLEKYGPPSPADTESVSDDGDAMDIDWQPSKIEGMPGKPIDRTWRLKKSSVPRPQTRSLYNHGTTQPAGWGAMRNEIFGIEDRTRAEDERKQKELEERAKLRYQPPVEQSPFRGRLPPAPRSVEARLRNPYTQVQFKETPLSKKQDFMKQMRDSFEHGKTFAIKNNDQQTKASVPERNGFDDDEDFSPVKTRTRGSLDIRHSTWALPGDGQEMTGLEDRLGGTAFSIADDVRVETVEDQKSAGLSSWIWLMLALPLAAVAVMSVRSVRRAVCLWLVEKMDEMSV